MSDHDLNPIAKKLKNQTLPAGGGGNKRRHRVPFYRKKWFGILAILILVSGVTMFAIVMAVLKPMEEQAKTFDLDALHKIETASQIYDRHGDEFGRIYMLNRTPIKIEQVPMHFIQALTAEEDSRFFQHSGVDMVGVARAMWLNYKAGSETQGASTITQQLAREAFKLKQLESGDKNSRYTRKIVEWFVAERVEEKYSKSEILELYLNRIYFGAGFYGIQAAAQGYFGKDAKNLTLEESATICGLIKSPNNIQPFRHPERAKKARNHVYDRMNAEGNLSRGEVAELSARPVVTAPRSADTRLSYVYEEIRQEATKIIGEEAALMGGFKIYTSIDAKLQQEAEKAVKERLATLEKRKGYEHQTFSQYRAVMENFREKINSKMLSPETPRPQPEYLQAAVLAIDNHDGGILAMVGGREFLDSMYNRALQSRRPAGSAFLPFVYATAFQSPDYFPPVQLEDGPLANNRVMIGGFTGILGEWGAEKEEITYDDHITAREALVESRNAATVRLGERLGRPAVIDFAAKAGFTSPIRDLPSTFLGASEVRLDEMCLAYSAFANLGKRAKEISLVHRITDSHGKVIYQVKEEDEALVTVMDETTAYQTHSCLTDALQRGTGRAAYDQWGLEKFPAAGKTGTHSEFKDLWFVGYTSTVTCGVWCGFDQQKPIYTGAFSNQVALPIWVDVMNATRKDYKAEVIQPPLDAQLVEVCRKSGLRATEACYEKVPDPVHGGLKAVRSTYKEVLRPGSSFNAYCTVHSGAAPTADMWLRADDSISGTTTSSDPQLVNVAPVRMQGLTVIGMDPYDSVQPILKAEPVNEDGTRVLKAEPVEDTMERVNPIKLAPPPPLKLD